MPEMNVVILKLRQSNQMCSMWIAIQNARINDASKESVTFDYASLSCSERKNASGGVHKVCGTSLTRPKGTDLINPGELDRVLMP